MNEMSKEPGQTATLPDGRQLGYLIVGEGKPVFWLSPSSRLQVLSLKGIAGSKHLQVIGVDRPGFGLSTYAPNMRITDFATDVSFLADHLGIDKFILVGWCAGGPYVITCAALISERIARALVISGASLPLDTSDMDLMGRITQKLPTVPIVGTWSTTIYVKMQKNMFMKILKGPDEFLKSWSGKMFLGAQAEEYVKFWTASSENREVFARQIIEMYHQGRDSIRASINQTRLSKREWEVDLSQITPGLVHIWHGTTDNIVPVSNSYKNAKDIPGAQLRIFENEGHLCWLNHLKELGDLLSS